MDLIVAVAGLLCTSSSFEGSKHLELLQKIISFSKNSFEKYSQIAKSPLKIFGFAYYDHDHRRAGYPVRSESRHRKDQEYDSSPFSSHPDRGSFFAGLSGNATNNYFQKAVLCGTLIVPGHGCWELGRSALALKFMG